MHPGALLYGHKTWTNKEDHQVVPAHDYHVEEMTYVRSLIYEVALFLHSPPMERSVTWAIELHC